MLMNIEIDGVKMDLEVSFDFGVIESVEFKGNEEDREYFEQLEDSDVDSAIYDEYDRMQEESKYDH